MASIVFALVGIGVLHLPRHWTLTITAAFLFVLALLTTLVDQAGW